MNIIPSCNIRVSLRFLLCIFAASFTVASLRPAGGQLAGSRSRWISISDGPEASVGVFSFRKLLQVNSAETSYMVNVSADSRFIFYVNGERVGDGPARGDVEHWRYKTIDIAKNLHRGTNVIAARVWNFGDQSPTAQISLRTGFLLWASADSQNKIDTDATWEVRLEPAWTFLAPGSPVGSNVGPNEVLDGRQYDWNWKEGTDTAGWTPAHEISKPVFDTISNQPATTGIWRLVSDKLPPMTYTHEPTGEVVRASGTAPEAFPKGSSRIQAHTHASFLIDRSTLTTAYPELKFSGGAGAKVRMTYAEALIDNQGQKGNRNVIAGKHMDPRMIHDEVIADGAAGRTFEPLWWRTWRYLQVDIDTQAEPIKLDSLSAHFTAYPFEEKAYFHSDDPSLEKIWNVGWRTTRLNAHETYMDCPYWEQLQYIGDTRIESLVSYVVAGDERLALQAIEAFASSIQPSRLTESRYPTRKVQVIPPFSLLWIGMLHDYWMYRPHADAVKVMLPITRSVLEYFTQLQRKDGLLGKMPQQGYNLWNFVDWTDAYNIGVPPQDLDGGSVPLSLQLADALNNAADLEQAFGDSSRGGTYKANAKRIAKTAYEKAWDGKRGLLADTPAHASYSEQTNILGVLTDSIPAAEQRKVLQDLLQKEGAADASTQIASASYYFRFYLSRAIEHAGLDDLYLETLSMWHKMLALGLSTWAEKPEPTRSDAHAWSAHPNYDLLTLVAGIKPDTPGFSTVLIAPHLGALTWVEAALPHPTGLIRVSYTRLDGVFKAHIELPPGLTGRFELAGYQRPLQSGPQDFTVSPSAK